MTDQELANQSVKRCLFCGHELPPISKAPTSRRVWVIACLALLGVAAAAFIGDLFIDGPPSLLFGFCNGIVISTTALGALFNCYFIRRGQIELEERLLAVQREIEESTEVKKGT